MSGLSKRGILPALQMEDRPGSAKEITDIVRAYGGRLVSVLTHYERSPAGYRNLYVRAYGVDRERMSEMLDEMRQGARLLYVVDHRENRRQEFVNSGPLV